MAVFFDVRVCHFHRSPSFTLFLSSLYSVRTIGLAHETVFLSHKRLVPISPNPSDLQEKVPDTIWFQYRFTRGQAKLPARIED